MTERIKSMKQFFIADRRHWDVRRNAEDPYLLAKQFEKEKTPAAERAVSRLLYMLKNEQPVIFEGEKIVMTRTIPAVPELFTEAELAQLKAAHWVHELGDVSNINVDYTKLLYTGFDRKKQEIEGYIKTFREQGETEKITYLENTVKILNAVQNLSERYRKKAVECGNETVAASLAQVPANPPRTFLEALQMFRIIHYTMWCGHNYHNTVGRFDQYMYPYLKADLEAGRLDYDSALELVEEFFLTFNRDSDLYPGMQQGDNGQSIVLGGRNEDGTDSYNVLSELCLKASLELKLIDPKINLRVHKNTSLETYVLGTQLTKQGLGFPQYSNDDVVIPGLMKLGYSSKDAHNYVVAACWEFIIPGAAMDIPNIEAFSFASAVDQAVFEQLENCSDYNGFQQAVYKNMREQTDELCEKVKNLYLFPAPFLSVMMDGCIENARDISQGCKYNNFGFHGTGIATAADSMAAIKKYVFEEQKFDKKELVSALKSDFRQKEQLCNMLRFDAPKMGNNDDYVDQIAAELLEEFAESVEGKKNERGGIFRAGTGSAMYYVWHSKDLPATPDGRHKGEGIAANYSPSLFSRCKGPVSIIKSFSKPNLERVINGGPLTLELHDTVFRTPEAIEKVATLVKSFMEMGGHQLQLNSVNRDTMLDAQKHPEKYRNLIVRVWGWSGYFVELDKEYQDHIIQRMELLV